MQMTLAGFTLLNNHFTYSTSINQIAHKSHWEKSIYENWNSL